MIGANPRPTEQSVPPFTFLHLLPPSLRIFQTALARVFMAPHLGTAIDRPQAGIVANPAQRLTPAHDVYFSHGSPRTSCV